MSGNKESVQLYRYLLKCIRTLPKDAQGYYKHYVRQGYNSHCDESDPERIRQIMARAKEDMQFILKKYKRE